ncbi:DUF402 domain-containing protein [Nocardioides marmotae]|uniref:DUF402 domain-containing protein n=1 Tax=Nocardioides marmotae TaxID=2663857 RepID=UPI0012B5DC18|nr:DUF402 domain-containing protein [Nocardioides marmotae]MBC9734541.1 DUF402 domain-containing protein [Nocardioides marmotae]MTB85642.1 DUF402 domain-containing protein [Nocardioides marmotae]
MSPSPAPPAGSRVLVRMAKWRDRPHWSFAAVALGSDVHGDWLGLPAGTSMTRPGASYVAPTDQVVLVPAAAPDAERAWVTTFHGEGGPLQAYVDITTPPVWDGTTLHAVDLDLDVLRGLTGRVWVDDEDEFAEHRVTLGYPPELCELAVASCARVRAIVEAGHAPYDGSARAWLARL